MRVRGRERRAVRGVPPVTYARPKDLGIVTSYFNPCDYRNRAMNFELFVDAVRSADIPLVIVEACFEGQGVMLAPRHASLRVMARDLMWQKERLLDLGTGWLPGHCSKVAWLDADVLFEDDDWAVATSEKLADAVVVQPFAEAVRLSEGATCPRENDEVFESFGSAYVNRPESLRIGKFEAHGHTGFAWAARRDVLARHGFYDACIAGSADHMMAHTFAGDWESPCVARMVGRGGRHRAHFRRWSEKVHDEVGARLSYTPGRLFHLWHGTMENRRYSQRNKELVGFAFDPKQDIRISDTGCWEWATDKPEMHAWARHYFRERREDDPA